ncbi:glutathione peroxidase [Oxalobacteraceae bacterium CAVE-383]|nr:glutathione peroxidase [Oxalobacteraceae bacterium CAVE-383]
MSKVTDFDVQLPDGSRTSLAQYRGKVLLIVNTASKCGFTPQYQGLQALYAQFAAQGLEVLAFPCNQFGEQEPGDAAAIGEFCETNYGVRFPLFAKIDVNGDHADPLFDFLKAGAPGILGTQAIKWNFTKFLVRRDGSIFNRYAPTTKPQDLIGDIQGLLAESVPGTASGAPSASA